MTKPAIHIGTSGWSYDHWHGPFYPASLPASGRLGYYAGRLASVEINSSFYHLPAPATLRHWHDSVPPGFVFAVKASRYLTHMKKLRDAAAAVSALFGRIEMLGDRLGPILFQLPPRWRCNPQRLEAFLSGLSGDFRYAFEFRDRSWLTREIYDLLASHDAALGIYDLDGFLSPRKVTAGFVYVRLHGPAGPYQGSYDTRTLAGWAGAFSSWARQGREVYCYFDNDQAGYAALNALRLQAMFAGPRARGATRRPGPGVATRGTRRQKAEVS
jgi:uncharacterized protein YecE (DUF72 family)